MLSLRSSNSFSCGLSSNIRFVSLLFALLRSQSKLRLYVRTYVTSDCSFVLLSLVEYSEWLKKHLRNFNSFINSCCVLRRNVRSWIQSIFFCSFFWLLSTYVRMWLDLVTQSFGLTSLAIKIKIVRTYVRTCRLFKTNNNKKKKTTPTSTTWRCCR